jgi:inner membrane protein
VLAIPYSTPPAAKDQGPGAGVFVVFPVTGEARVDSKSEVRQRSLFKVPVYVAELNFTARFDLRGVQALTPRGATLDWGRAEILVGATDPRGAQSDVTLSLGGQPRAVAPAAVLTGATLAGDAAKIEPDRYAGAGGSLRFFGASAAGFGPETQFDASATLRFSGAQRFAVLPFAKTTQLKVKGDWPSPSFDGGFLPRQRELGPNGFTADWNVPFIARGVPAQGDSDLIERLQPSALGVSFVESANPYQSVARSLKYALMFVGLVFLAYFLFETTQGKRVHPAQYVLIGLAQVVFYLLLLSIAERIGFDGGFAIAASATVGLISAYAGWVFESRRQGVIALICFSALYGLIYVLMRLEDWALLVGAFASFAAIAAAMFITRRLDWYGSAAPLPDPAPTSLKDAA